MTAPTMSRIVVAQRRIDESASADRHIGPNRLRMGSIGPWRTSRFPSGIWRRAGPAMRKRRYRLRFAYAAKTFVANSRAAPMSAPYPTVCQ